MTRAPHQASQLAVELEHLGATVIAIPAIEIAPPDDYAPLDRALLRASGFDWIIFTSANAVRVFGERMELLKIEVSSFSLVSPPSPGIKFAAVGPATAAAIRNLGLEVSATPEKYVGEALAASLGERVAGERVLMVRAKVARDVVPEMLRRAGATVETVEAYQNVIPGASVEAFKRLFGSVSGWPDAVTFTSSSSAQNFFSLLKEAQSTLPPNMVLASIGPITSATLVELSHAPDCEAEQATVAGLAAALGKHFTCGRSSCE